MSHHLDSPILLVSSAHMALLWPPGVCGKGRTSILSEHAPYHAGFAPFGFGYRRCPGEQLNIAIFSDLLGKVWADKIEFERLDLASPAKIPAGPLIVVDDNIGFTRQS